MGILIVPSSIQYHDFELVDVFLGLFLNYILLILVTYFYNVTVTTGNKFGAGTDANIFLRLIGEKGSTDEIRLETKKHELERGM